MTTHYRMVVDKVVQDMSAEDAQRATGGFPSYTTANRDLIQAPYAGMTIRNTTTNKLNFYDGSAWVAVTSA